MNNAEARLQKSRLTASLVAIVAFALFAVFAFDRGLRGAAICALLLVLGISAFALVSWGRWAGARLAPADTTPPAAAAIPRPGVGDESLPLSGPDADAARKKAIDADLDTLSREELVHEVVRLRNAIRAHGDSIGQHSSLPDAPRSPD